MAILVFAGVADLKVVSVKKNTEVKTVEIAEKLLKKNTHFISTYLVGGNFLTRFLQNFLGKPGSSWFNQEVPG